MITMILVSLTTMIESTGVFFALSEVTGQKLTSDDIKRGYRAEGIAAILGGLFNYLPLLNLLRKRWCYSDVWG